MVGLFLYQFLTKDKQKILKIIRDCKFILSSLHFLTFLLSQLSSLDKDEITAPVKNVLTGCRVTGVVRRMGRHACIMPAH
jgi:hypothetical protein